MRWLDIENVLFYVKKTEYGAEVWWLDEEGITKHAMRFKYHYDTETEARDALNKYGMEHHWICVDWAAPIRKKEAERTADEKIQALEKRIEELEKRPPITINYPAGTPIYPVTYPFTSPNLPNQPYKIICDTSEIKT